jgi:hypothetical protein
MVADVSMTGSGTPTDDPSASPTAYVILVFVAVFVIVLIALQAYFGRALNRELEVKVLEREPQALDELRAEQAGQIHGYRWVDREAGVVAIPIERAMDITARELAQGSR